MAVKIIANYSKRLGLPGFSSHQFSVSVETELNHTDNILQESNRLYKTLQTAVDSEMQNTGFVPSAEYGSSEVIKTSQPALKSGSGNDLRNRTWKASDKQRDLIFKLVENNGLEFEVVEDLALEMFDHAHLAELNRIQIGSLIDELLSRYGKRDRREASSSGRFHGRMNR